MKPLKKPSVSAVFLLILVILTLLRWDVIWNSTLSLAYALVLIPTGAISTISAMAVQLLEYWIAVAVWWGAMCYIALRALAPHRRGSRTSDHVVPPSDFAPKSFVFIIVISFLSLTAPFVSPVPPNAQGPLQSSRLLPPLAQGVLLDVDQAHPFAASVGAEGRFEGLAQWLLSRRTCAAGVGGGATPEGWRLRGNYLFLFGTDDVGRDVFSRVIAGARVSLGIGLAAALLSVLLGSIIGFSAGLGGRRMDFVLMRFVDLALAIPGLFLAIGLMAFLGQSLATLIIVLACTGWMGAARVVRSEVAALREREYVLAARLLGVRPWRLVVRHMLPNMVPVLVSMGILQFANAALAEAALGFLGLGVQPPTATWGNMMGEGMGLLQSGWWVGLFPGAFLAAVLVAAHEIAEGRDFDALANEDRIGGYDQPPIQDSP